MSRVYSIEELLQKCAEKNIPLERMRFFIGEDRREVKCFGVFQDENTGNWIVYKNKSDGRRAIRYNGPDEAEAAQIIWDKIGEEIKLRKDLYASPYDDSAFPDEYNFRYGASHRNKPSHRSSSGYRNNSDYRDNSGYRGNSGLRGSSGFRDTSGYRGSSGYRNSGSKDPTNLLEKLILLPSTLLGFLWEHKVATIISIFVFLGVFSDVIWPSYENGYYQRGDETYYCLDDDWYIYEAGEWIATFLDDENIEDYYLGDAYYDDYGVSDFIDTDYYSDYIANEYTGTYYYNDHDYNDDYNNDYDDYDDDYGYDDDDYDYDFDFWDTEDTDWDSDW